jgi:peptidoglycan-associated lipoprotein
MFSGHFALFIKKEESKMNRNTMTLLTGVAMAALLASGCASNEAVKKDAPVLPVIAAEKVEPAKPVEPIVQPVPVAAKAEAEVPVVPVTPAAPVIVAAKAAEEVKSEKASAPVTAFETVYFDFDKADLRQDARDILSKNAEIILKSMAGAKVQIEGHCDERGSAEYNLALGENRAKSAQKYLTTLGVKADTISIISYGKEKPAVKGNDEAAWSKNRRAEFVVVK